MGRSLRERLEWVGEKVGRMEKVCVNELGSSFTALCYKKKRNESNREVGQ